MLINWKEVVINPYTRFIAKQVAEKMLENVVIKSVDWIQNMEMPATNNDKSEELLVRLMTGLEQSEIDNLENSEYETLKNEINKIINGKKK